MLVGYIMEADSVDMSSTSGPEQHVRAVIEGLLKRGHVVRLLAFQNNHLQWTDDLIKWHLVDNEIKMSPFFRLIESVLRHIQSRLNLPFFRFFDSVRFSQACLTIFKDFDVLYERDGTISYGGLLASKRLKIPIILEVNGDLIAEWEHLGLSFSKSQSYVIHVITKMVYKYVSHIVSVGETLKRRLVERWKLNPNHITVVTNGADVQKFLDPSEDFDVRKRFSIPSGPLLAFSGGFQPWHGVELILDGFRRSLEVEPGSGLVLIGDGPTKMENEILAKQMGLGEHAFFVGRVEHLKVANILHASDLAIIYHRASAAEIVETPLKLFEYMASGKAIIAPDVPNMRRILDDQVNALLIPPDDPDALGRAIVKLLNDSELRSRLGSSARADAITKHSWDRVVLDLEKIFGEVIEKNRWNGNEKM